MRDSMVDILIGKVHLSQETTVEPPGAPITLPPGKLSTLRLKAGGTGWEGEILTEGDLEGAEIKGDELLLYLTTPEREGPLLLQLGWEGGELLIPLKISREAVNVEEITLKDGVPHVVLSGPEDRRIRGDLTVVLEGEGGEVLSEWKRRVAVRGTFTVSAPLNPPGKEGVLIRATFSKGDIRAERVLRLREERPAVESRAREVQSSTLTPSVKPTEVEEKSHEAQLKVSLLLPQGSEEGLFPSERVLETFQVGPVTVKRLSSPTLIIEGGSEEDARRAIFTLLYLSDDQRTRFRELFRLLNGLISIYGTGEGKDVEWLIEELDGTASGSKGALEELSGWVEGELKELKGLKVRDEVASLKEFRRALAVSRENIERALREMDGKTISPHALPRALAAELISTLGALKYFFLWERGIWRDYPSLSAQERKLIKGAVETMEALLKRLGRVQSLASEIVSRNRQNRAARDALQALSRLEAEIEGLDGRRIKSGEGVRGLLKIRCGKGGLSCHLLFRLSSNLALRRPLASYSGGVLKTESLSVAGETAIPLEVELLKGGGDEAQLEVTLVPEFPPLIREVEL